MCITDEKVGFMSKEVNFSQIERAARVRERVSKTITYALLTLWGILVLFPFYWMILTSVKSYASYNAEHIPAFFTLSPTLQNYADAFTAVPLGQYFLNTIIFTVCTTALMLIVVILAAFAFTRLNFRGRDTLFAVSLGMMMVPFEMLVITNYITIADLGLIDTLIAMIIPFTSSIFHTFILRGFFQSIPDSLYYSARIDGAGNWSYLWRVMVPIAKPAIVTNVLLGTITSWNSFLWPMLVTNVPESRTLPFGLYAFMHESGIRYERLMAGATIVVLPMIILFLFARKSIVSGVARGGIKG